MSMLVCCGVDGLRIGRKCKRYGSLLPGFGNISACFAVVYYDTQTVCVIAGLKHLEVCQGAIWCIFGIARVSFEVAIDDLGNATAFCRCEVNVLRGLPGRLGAMRLGRERNMLAWNRAWSGAICDKRGYEHIYRQARSHSHQHRHTWDGVPPATWKR